MKGRRNESARLALVPTSCSVTLSQGLHSRFLRPLPALQTCCRALRSLPPMLSQAPRRATRLILAHSGRPSACLTRNLALSPSLSGVSYTSTRTFLSWFKSKPKDSQLGSPSKGAEKKGPILSQDDLFHPFSKSPFPAIRARGEAIQQLAQCPVCTSEQSHGVHSHHAHGAKALSFECPDCGWPTHCSAKHWSEDLEHQKYCGRLREVNEDEHDLRSGRRMKEFELPGSPTVLFNHW